MNQSKKILALIPARGGSKGLPEKNIRPFHGKPLIAWTIESALRSRFIDGVVVSTEDDHIAKIAGRWGARVPFKRPPELASDEASSMDVILHAQNFLESQKQFYDILILLQPTSPLRTSDHIDEALEWFEKIEANAVVSVSEAEHPPAWTNTLPPDLCMKGFIEDRFRDKKRQDFGKYYRLNGAIYISRWNYLKKNKDWFSERTFAYVMDRKHSVDIDSLEDFICAEALMKQGGNHE